MTPRALLCCVALTACPSGATIKAPPPGAEGSDDSPAAGADSGAHAPTPAAACADGTWSGWESPEGLLHVQATGSDTDGDGSSDRPYQTLHAALQASIGSGDVAIAVGAGTFTGPIALLQGPLGTSMTVRGCGAGETVLQATIDGGAAALVAIAGATPVTLARMRLEPDGAGVVVRKGANATLSELRISGPEGVGVAVIGDTTRATLQDVSITNTHRNRGRLEGWGVLATGASVVLQDVTVQATPMMGVYQHGGRLEATGLEVVGPSDPERARLGFGIYAFEATSVHLAYTSVSRVQAGGVVLVEVPDVALRQTTVAQVVANRTGGGDGVVIARRGGSGALAATLDHVTVSGAARMGIALAGVEATLQDTTAGADNGLVVDGRSVFADAESVVVGDATSPFDRRELRLLQSYAAEQPHGWGIIP